jgi:hypothetical protein
MIDQLMNEYMRQMIVLYYWPYFVVGNGDNFKNIMLCRVKRQNIF